MLVLHAVALDGGLAFWGEVPTDASGADEASTGAEPTTGAESTTDHSGPAGSTTVDESTTDATDATDATHPGATPHHPFSAPFAALAGALAPFGPAREERAVAWLPASGGPLPSTPMLGGDSDHKSPTIEAFLVTTAVLDGAATGRALLAAVGRRVLAPGVIVGADLAGWAQVARYATGLVVRQRFLPGLRLDGGRSRAVWEALPTPADAAFLSALVASMPPSATAITTSREAPRPTPRAAVAAVVASLVDALVRDAQPPQPPRPFASLQDDATATLTTPVAAPQPPRPFASLHDAPTAAPTEPVAALQPPGDAASLHDVWVAALGAPDGAMEATDDEHRTLAEAIERWRAPLTMGEAAPYRLALRLEEPGPESGLWTLRPLVAPVDDPSLLVPVEDLFGRARVREALARPDADVRAFALAALARAAATAPMLAGALSRTPPAAVALETELAHTFLTETALLLEAAGFSVLLPSWFTRGAERARLTLHAQAEAPLLKAGAGLHMGAVVHVDWQVALGDDLLSREELESLAALKAPLVRLRGQWVVVDKDAIHTALDRWQRRNAVTVRELVQARIGAPSPMGLPVASVSAEGPLGELLGRLDDPGRITEAPVPKALSATLRPYQRRGLSWMAFLTELGFGGCLADDMGLGKTVQTLALLAHARERGERRPMLLVCPTSLLCNWQKEAARFLPDLPVLVHHGAGRARGEALVQAAYSAGLVLVSYGLLLRDLGDLQRVAWSGMVLDEAQNVKNPSSQQARAARAVPAPWRIALTGTPVENHVGELWAILDLVNPGLLGSAAAFHRAFFVPIQGGDRDAARRLQRLSGPFVLRRLKTDPGVAPDLPERILATVACTLTREQATLYAAVLQETDAALATAEGMERKGLVLQTITRLKQVCNHPAQLLRDASGVGGRSGKLERLTSIVDEVSDGGEALLVFTQFAEMGRIIVRHLGEALGIDAPFLHGGVSRGQRDAMVERFQRDDGPPVLVLSLKAGGTGLNLTRASHVVHYDRWWNPAVENQASDRAWRIGQRRTVQVHTLVCAGTFEERIDALLGRKQRMASRVVASGEAGLTELSNDELRRVLALTASTLDEADGE